MVRDSRGGYFNYAFNYYKQTNVVTMLITHWFSKYIDALVQINQI